MIIPKKEVETMTMLGNRKIHLFTFGGGNFNYRRASRRLGAQAKTTQLFSSVTNFTDRDLEEFIPNFNERHKDFIRSNKKGFGYWLWKPYLINYALEKIAPNEILVYVDSGAEFNLESKPAIVRWNEYLRFVDKHHCLAFQLESRGDLDVNPQEICYSKKYLIDFLKPTNLSLTSNQILAGSFFLKKTERNIQFIERWIHVATSDNYKYLNDFLSQKENRSFVAHRNDQSIFSLLYKHNGMFFIPDETDSRNNLCARNNWPIWHIRNRSGISRGPLKTNDLFDRLFNFFRVLSLHLSQYLRNRLKF